MRMKHDDYGELPYLDRPNKLPHTPRATAAIPRMHAVSGPLIQLRFNHAKITGAGEDSDPIHTSFGAQHGLIAVFDGLGGSGSEVYRDQYGCERTGAYIASRIVRDDVEAYYKSLSVPLEINSNVLNPLKERIQQTINQWASMYARSESRILSSMRRTLPTTMAGVFYAPAQNGNAYHCDVVWAGDSRVYCLTPDAGLQQLTRDHVKGSSHNTLNDFVQDSPINNCVQANAEFYIEHKRFVIDGPLMLIAATDGCYSALPSPAHFERIVLAQLQQSTSCKDWETRICDELCVIAQDDVSMSVIGLGVPDFVYFQQLFRTRIHDLEHAMNSRGILKSHSAHNSAITQPLEVLQPNEWPQRLTMFWEEYYHSTYTARLKEYKNG